MEQLVKVQKCNPDGTAEVLCIRESACSGDCHKCSGCGAVQQKLLLTAHNPVGAQPGDMVTLKADSGPVLLGAAVLYMLPLVFFFLGYLVFAFSWKRGSLGGCVGFALGILAAVLYDRFVAKKQKNVYTITGYHNTMPEVQQKGDN